MTSLHGMTPADRAARVELRSAILRSRMTPAERAIAAGHPSTHNRSDAVGPPPATASAGSAAAAADPTPFDDFHATVTSINVAADRLRLLKGGR